MTTIITGTAITTTAIKPEPLDSYDKQFRQIQRTDILSFFYIVSTFDYCIIICVVILLVRFNNNNNNIIII